MRKNWDDFSFYMMKHYSARINIHEILNQQTGNKSIHQVMLLAKLVVCLIMSLLNAGATLQDTNASGKTPLDLLLDAKAYDKIVIVMQQFSDSVTKTQLAKVFQHLIQEQRYDLYAELLLMHAANRPSSEKDFLVGVLSGAVRHLNIHTVVSVVTLLDKNDPTLLKYIGLAVGADLKTKKLAVDQIIREMLQQENSALDILALIQKLEVETASPQYPNLSFYRERDAASLFGHIWQG